jgi:antitoxin (DNA-binding transcriptional repressor) of toxin-antitoxin stability system
MTITVSISQFRQNISDYLAQVKAGDTLILKDEKKNEEIAEIVGRKKFDLDSFKATLKKVAGTFSAENHPEWRTKKDVIKWVEQSRKAADRTF